MLLCPYCQGSAKPLPTLSSVSLIDFFQCEACAKISERPRAPGDHSPRLVILSNRQSQVATH